MEDIKLLLGFWKHSNQHDSKTQVFSQWALEQFWKHSNQHDSKTP